MIKKLYIEPSSACNLNCKMCFRNNWFGETIGLMDNHTVERVLAEIANGSMEHVFFGGMGEPLLHPRILEMISLSSKNGKTTELITNATLLSADMSQRLKEAGLSRLWVSMDGFSNASYEEIRRGSVYKTIIDNLDDFCKAKGDTHLGFTFVMMKENIGELQYINTFADRYGADVINLSHVLPGEPLKAEDALYDSGHPIGKMRRLGDRTEPLPEGSCPFIEEDTCFVRFDGEVCPCMQLLHSSYSYFYEERRKIHAKSYGNINTNSLDKIYHSDDYFAFKKRVSDFAFPCCTVCMGCEDRLENQADCMYNTAPTCGACLWAQGWIRCP